MRSVEIWLNHDFEDWLEADDEVTSRDHHDEQTDSSERISIYRKGISNSDNLHGHKEISPESDCPNPTSQEEEDVDDVDVESNEDDIFLVLVNAHQHPDVDKTINSNPNED